MLTIQAKSVSSGVAIGKIFLYQKNRLSIERRQISDPAAEIERFHEAKQNADEEWQKVYRETEESLGEDNAAIFEVYRMLLKDENFVQSVENKITEQSLNAEAAVADTAKELYRQFAAMEDDYMQARALDIQDVGERLLVMLGDEQEMHPVLTEDSIVLADNLTPSQTVRLDKKKILAFVTVRGSLHSHVAVLARGMNIPALVAAPVSITQDLSGRLAVVDGGQGMLYVDPDRSLLRHMRAQTKEQVEKGELLRSLKGKEDITQDGRRLTVNANISGIQDLAAVLENDAGGIGLLRSEFLYLQKDRYPTEEELFEAYKTAAETMAGKTVVIRTMDIGADKNAAYFGLKKEENPAMGMRAVRIYLERPHLLKTQLRAIFRAAVYGNVAVMYPMIISVPEIRQLKAIAGEVLTELKEKGIPHVAVRQGIMIETPAAALISEELAKEADFFSIGTNDLTQYTLAIDRQNPDLESFYDPHHPAVLRMIAMTAENARKAGIPVAVCGDLGADPSLTDWFIRIGVEAISVSPNSVLPMRKHIRELAISE